jgi:hypothetical protein
MNKILYIFHGVILGLYLPNKSLAQHSSTAMTGFTFSPDALEVSPSKLPDFKYHLALPHIQSTVANSFSLHELFIPAGDSVLLSLKPWKSPDANPLEINVQQRIRVLSLGMGITPNTYAYLGASVQANVGFALPAGLLAFADGRGDFNFDGFRIEALSYAERHIGLIHRHNKFAFGGKLRYLNGLVNVHTQRNHLEFAANSSELSIQSDLLLQSSNLQENDELGRPNGNFPDIRSFLALNHNKGFALDLGLTYQIDQSQSLEVSVLNLLGQIKWTQNVSAYRFSGSFANIAPVYQIKPTQNTIDLFQGIEDSLANAFRFDTLSNAPSYRTQLPLTLVAHYQYQIKSGLRAGGIATLLWADQTFVQNRPQISGYIQTDLARFTSLRVLMHASSQRIAFGSMFSLRLLGAQVCLGVDNFRQFYNQSATKLFQVNAGISLCLGSRSSRIP